MPPKISDLSTLFLNAVSALIVLAGIVLFIMLMVGGVKFITSGGDPKSVEGAKHTITYAVGGLLLILLSYLILVIISNITGAAGLLKFTIVQ